MNACPESPKRMRNNAIRLLGAFLLLAVAGCARPPEDWQPTTLEAAPVPLTDLAKALRMHADQTPKYWRLTGGSHEVRIYPGLTMAWMDDEFLQLDSPVAEENGVPLVSPYLAEIIRIRVGRDIPDARPVAAGLKVVLDAGHGGKDCGAIGTRGTHEKTVVLDITDLAASILRESGCEVILTRDRDVFIELRERAEIANRRGADLFVSIHANAMDPKARPMSGLEVYYPTYAFRLKAAQEDLAAPPPTRILESTRESLKLARAVHDAILDHTWCKSNGIREHPKALAVLRYTHCPAVLVEVGYLTDVEEEAKLREAEYRKRVAHAIADGILDYFKVASGGYASN